MNTIAKDAKILLVEDHPDIVEMYIFAFKKMAGVELHLAHDKLSALEQAKKVRPDLILLDLIIPERDDIHANSRYGFDVLQALRKDAKLKNVPVIVLTNLDSPDDRKRSAELQALDYIVKAEVIPTKIVERAARALKEGK